jgi:hypothetical protein
MSMGFWSPVLYSSMNSALLFPSAPVRTSLMTTAGVAASWSGAVGVSPPAWVGWRVSSDGVEADSVTDGAQALRDRRANIQIRIKVRLGMGVVS